MENEKLKNKNAKWWCLFTVLLLPAFVCAGQKPDAGQPGYFLKLATGANILGMGGAGVACSNSGIFINPAGIAMSEKKNIQLTTIVLPFPDTSYNFLSYTSPIERNWGIGLGVPVLKVTGAEKRTGEYETSGTFDDQYIAFGLGVARKFSSGLSAGLAIKAIQQRFYETTTTTNDINIGILYQHMDSNDYPISMGMSIQNILGSTIKQAIGEDEMPRTIKAGVSYRPINRMLLTVEMQKASGQALRTYLGGEYSLINPLSLRAGYDNQGHLTAGVGLQLAGITLDYGLQNHSYKLSHRVSVGVEFGAKVSK